MDIQVDNIPKTERKYFKTNLIASENRLNVVFSEDKAIVTIREAYFPTEDDLIRKNNIKKNIYNFISEFRQYQFNKGV